MSTLIEASATGDVKTVDTVLHSVTLTAGADAASVVVRDGSGGSAILTIKAAANSTVSWRCGSREGVFFGTAVHATFTGTSPTADFEVA